jgi:hypothetical protein
MDEMDPLKAAGLIVSERFPSAEAAFLAGSVLTAKRTATSDLDILVFLGEDDQAFRETLRLHGWLTELFVETPWSFHYFVNLETRARRSPLLQMCAHGAILLSLDGAAERYQNESRHMLAKGPPPITKDELDQRRYELTNLLDDFIGSISSEELTYVTGQLLTKSSELALLSGSQWLGAGKWLARRLQQFNPDLLIRLDGAVRSVVQDNDRAPMQSTVREVLDTVGGPLSEGYRNVAKPAHKPTKFNEPARPSDVSEVDRRRSAPTADAS